MRKNFRARLLGTTLFIGAGVLAAPAFAQTTPPPQDDDAVVQETGTLQPRPDGTGDTGEAMITVTGSRIRQQQFSSPTPIQVLEAEDARQLGVTSAQDLLQRTTVASGTQIDATLNTAAGTSNGTEAPPTGGTGSSNIDLRGLGQERTLVLLNGRRLGSGGVRGAPAQPDISLLPLALIERVEIVTEGASSIYGADAVAGVVNVILRNDFEGLELSGGLQYPEAGAGEIATFSAVAGASGERARIMIGVDFYRRNQILAGQRDFSSSSRAIVEDEAGVRYELPFNGLFDNIIYAPAFTPGVASDNFLFYTPGQSNTGVPNFSNYLNLPPLQPGYYDRCGISINSCYANFTYFDQYNQQDELRAAPLVQPLTRYSFVANGSYDIAPEHDIEAYVEALYFNRQQKFNAQTEQIFPGVPGVIPVVDAQGFALRNPDGTLRTVDNPFNPFSVDVEPIISLSQIGQQFTVELQQHRIVAGLRGNVPGEWFRARNWSFDAYVSYDRSTGFQSQPVINELALLYGTQGVYATEDGTIGCGPIDNIPGGFFSLPDCVPINFFNSGVYATGPDDDGSLTAEEYNFLVGNRTFRTVVGQTMYSANLTGELFNMPTSGEPIRFALGFEHRDDYIESQHDLIASQGLNAAENPAPEGSTIGERDLNELYAEIALPILRDQPFFHELTVDGAARYTDESNFGDDITYRIRALWRPVSWVQLSGSHGTSYRAPNLREQFLAPQASGVGGNVDPCISTSIAARLASATGGDSDPAFVNLVNNCIASGVIFTDANGNNRPDTTDLGSGGILTIPVFNGGNADLLPETSESWTATAAISPPFFGPVRVDLSASYYDIRVQNSVNELDASAIIGRCYLDQERPLLSSPFCDQIDRQNFGPATSRRITQIRSGFSNTGSETVKGLDFNARFRFGLDDLIGGPDVSVTLAGAASYILERDFQVLPNDPVVDLVGTFGYPEWKAQGTFGLEFGPWRFVTQGRYIGEQHAITRSVFGASATFADPTGARRTVRLVDYVDDIYYQDASLTYDAEHFTITAGITNLFDRAPNLINNGYANQRNNAFTGSGYDFFGRTFFVNGTVRF